MPRKKSQLSLFFPPPASNKRNRVRQKSRSKNVLNWFSPLKRGQLSLQSEIFSALLYIREPWIFGCVKNFFSSSRLKIKDRPLYRERPVNANDVQSITHSIDRRQRLIAPQNTLRDFAIESKKTAYNWLVLTLSTQCTLLGAFSSSLTNDANQKRR